MKKLLLLSAFTTFLLNSCGGADQNAASNIALVEGYVKKGVSSMVSLVERIGHKHGIEFPMQMSLGISNGESLYGFRYSSEGQSRSLFHSDRIEAIKDLAPKAGRFTIDTRALVSEPVGEIKEAWIPIPESSFIEVNKGEVIIEDLKLD